MASGKALALGVHHLLYLYLLLAGALFTIAAAVPVNALTVNGTVSQLNSLLNHSSITKRDVLTIQGYQNIIDGGFTEDNTFVRPGSQDFQDFTTCGGGVPKTIFSKDFNSCFGFIVVSDKGAFMAHYIATYFSDPVRAPYQKLIDQYNMVKAKLPGAHGYLFVPATGYDDYIPKTQAMMKQYMGLDSTVVSYVYYPSGAKTPAEKYESSIVVASAGGKPEVWHNGRRLYTHSSKRSAVAKRNIINDSQYLAKVKQGQSTATDMWVASGRSKYQSFTSCAATSTLKTIHSKDFASCIGIVLVNEKGALISHLIAAQLIQGPGEQGFRAPDAVQYYNSNKAALQGASVYIFVAQGYNVGGTYMSQKVANAKRVVAELMPTGKEPKIVYYPYYDRADPTPKTDAEIMKTSILVASNGGTPEVYLGGVKQ